MLALNIGRITFIYGFQFFFLFCYISIGYYLVKWLYEHVIAKVTKRRIKNKKVEVFVLLFSAIVIASLDAPVIWMGNPVVWGISLLGGKVFGSVAFFTIAIWAITTIASALKSRKQAKDANVHQTLNAQK